MLILFLLNQRCLLVPPMKRGLRHSRPLLDHKITKNYNYSSLKHTCTQTQTQRNGPSNEDFKFYKTFLKLKWVNFFVQLLYSTVAEVCTEETCPIMSGGPKYEYLWQDGTEFKVSKKALLIEQIDYCNNPTNK